MKPNPDQIHISPGLAQDPQSMERVLKEFFSRTESDIAESVKNPGEKITILTIKSIKPESTPARKEDPAGKAETPGQKAARLKGEIADLEEKLNTSGHL